MSSQEPANHESVHRARREAWLQIYLPVIVVALVAIGMMIWLSVGGSAADASILADFSLALVILPACVLGLFVIGTFIALTIGIVRLVQGIPPYTGKVQRFMKRVYEGVDAFTDRIAGVVIAIRSFLVGLEALIKRQTEEEAKKDEQE
jgi:hypothetical protein